VRGRYKLVSLVWLLVWAASVSLSAEARLQQAASEGGGVLVDAAGTRSMASAPAAIGPAHAVTHDHATPSSDELPRGAGASEHKISRADFLGLASTPPVIAALRAFELARIVCSAAPLRARFSTASPRAPPA